MTNYNVSGAGETTYNGLYADTGSGHSTKGLFKLNDLHWLYWDAVVAEWSLGPAYIDDEQRAYGNADASGTPPFTGWVVAALGSEPPPVISEAGAGGSVFSTHYLKSNKFW